VFDSNQHDFNLDFPPPAFIGDVDNAPIVILLLNGGYDPNETPAEFRAVKDREEFLDWLKGLRADFPRNLSKYYTEQPTVSEWVKQGKAVIVNAVAYRSRKISEEVANKKLAKLLPSAIKHKEWLHNELLPDVRAGRRYLVAHRWRLWGIRPKSFAHWPNVRFSSNPASPYLSANLKKEVGDWLSGRRIRKTSCAPLLAIP
jgi:hypothetical protein